MKTIMITGATDGLGKALAKILAPAGYALMLCGRSQDKMNALLQELNRSSLFCRCFDISDKKALHDFIEQGHQHFGRIDVLINNAGANFKKARIEDLEEEDLIGMFELNCLAGFRCIKQIYPIMKMQNSGHIINILSSACLYDNETMAGYTVSKQAMNAISHILTKEALADHIKVTSFFPGGIDTAFRTLERPDYLDPKQVAFAIKQLIELPEELNVQEYVVRPQVEKNF